MLNHHRRTFTWFCLLLMLVIIPVQRVYAQDGQVLVVGSDGPYTSIDAALEAAQDGDIIEVHGGHYPAPVIVVKSVRLIGINNPVIDGGGEGTLVFIAAPDVTFQGFTVQNSGTIQHHEPAGIIIEAPRATVADNTFVHVLNGIFFSNAPDGIARNNTVYGIGDEPALRGDGVRIWYSHGVNLIDNTITHSRDTLIWYSDNLVIRNNVFRDNRYGLHFMYNNGATVEGNTFEENSVGSFLMYSKNTVISENIFAYNRGPSGYGLALKDMDEVQATDNFFVGNRAGLYLDNSPALVDVYNHFIGNVFAYNDIGTMSLPSVRHNIFQRNSYLDNTQQVGIRGREVVSRNIWSQDGMGNYWSDYVGYDGDGDGFGEIAYKSDRLFESLVDQNPALQLFTYSPAVQAIEFASAAFPVLRPQPKLVDDTPMMDYEFPHYLEANDGSISTSLLVASLLLMGFVASFGVVMYERPDPEVGRGGQLAPVASAAVVEEGKPMIVVENLTKQYGRTVVLEDVSFTIQAGESVALWGTNGAGKTTTLRCLLGVQSFKGQITVNSINVRRDGKAARSAIGYIPQEANFYDMSVWQTLKFYARLRKVPTVGLDVLERVGLAEHAHKRVAELSGGMKQRLALAISLLSDPPVLLLDEPTANLDTQAQQDFLKLILSLNQAGKTVIFSSHRVDEVVALASRVLMLQTGRLMRSCTPQELVEELGLRRWLKLWIPDTHWEPALATLRKGGFETSPNGSALFIPVGATNKMVPLRLLQDAEIPVEDFDIVDSKERAQ